MQAAPDLDVEALGVDLASLSAHKVYGPKGIGALYVRSGVELAPLVRGGSQERARRGGTQNVAAAVGLAEALARATGAAEERAARLRGLRQHLAERLRDAFGEQVRLNTPLAEEAAAPHVLSVSFPAGEEERPLDGEMLLLNLDVEGVRFRTAQQQTLVTVLAPFVEPTEEELLEEEEEEVLTEDELAEEGELVDTEEGEAPDAEPTDEEDADFEEDL